MKISPRLDCVSFSLCSARPGVYGPAHLHHHGRHDHIHAGCVHRPECCDHRRDCDDRRGDRWDCGGPGTGDPCAFPRQSYPDYLHKQNLREHDRFESCRNNDACGRERDERPSCAGHRDARDMYDMPRIGDVSKSEFNRAVERAVQTYLIRAITNTGGAIDLFA